MSTTLETPTTTAPGPLAEVAPYRFSADDFYRMIDLDIFPRESRVGLWDGQVYEKMAKKQSHSVSGSKLVTALLRALPPDWCVWPENPITLAPDKAPLPDMAVLRGRADDYRHRRAEADDIGLIVELSDSSLRIDTKVKLVAYAKAGVATYWVVNLVDDRVQVYEMPDPVGGRYTSERAFGRGSMIPLRLGGVEVGPIAADDVLPLP